MKAKRRGWALAWTTMLGLGLAGASGCQTWVPEAGLTLPSPNYLRHPPQYIPRSPDFPLSQELANLEEALARQGQPAPADRAPAQGAAP